MGRLLGSTVPTNLVAGEVGQEGQKCPEQGYVTVFQATNRFIQIMQVEKRHAIKLGPEVVLVSDIPESWTGAISWHSSSDQILMTRDCRLLEHPRIAEAANSIRDRLEPLILTAAHDNLIRIPN